MLARFSLAIIAASVLTLCALLFGAGYLLGDLRASRERPASVRWQDTPLSDETFRANHGLREENFKLRCRLAELEGATPPRVVVETIPQQSLPVTPNEEEIPR